MDSDREALMGSSQRLHSASSGMSEITVYDTDELYGERGRFRVLQFGDGAVQGAMDLNDPGRIVLEYPRAILHLLDVNYPSSRDIFLIGHGIGTIAGHASDARIKTAELDAAVVELSRIYFGCRQENVIVGDGRQLLACEEESAYDAIVVDAFTEKGVPRQLCSHGFFRLASAKLSRNGAVIMNVFGRVRNDQLIGAIRGTIGLEFPFVRAFALPQHSLGDNQNIIVAGSRRPIDYHARRMAGFQEIELQHGYILLDE
jgi:spermidine synthase